MTASFFGGTIGGTIGGTDQITENGTILCPYHNSEFCFRSGEVKKWVGLKAEDAKKECEPLKIIPTLSKDSYIWVKKD